MRIKSTRNRMVRAALEIGQRFRIDVLPRHYYSAIPDIRRLGETKDWRKPRTMVAVRGMDAESQLTFLRSLPFTRVPPDVYERACRENGAVGFGPVESVVLHAFVARYKPPHIVQIGAGVSTSVILRALRESDFDAQVTCVDPFPTKYLRRLAATGQIQLLEAPAQVVEMDTFTGCGPGDLIFVDSTHTVQPGSEVNRIVLEILPRLKPRVFVHFHDITWPYDYPRDLLDDRFFFWEESTLLHAFLCKNDGYIVRACLSFLHYEHPLGLQRLIPSYRPEADSDGLKLPQTASGCKEKHFPSSVYLEAVSSVKRSS